MRFLLLALLLGAAACDSGVTESVELVQPLQDITVYTERDTVRYDLTDYFDVNTKDSLAYKSTSSNTNVVTWTEGSILSIYGRWPGESTITVRILSGSRMLTEALFVVTSSTLWCREHQNFLFFKAGDTQRYALSDVREKYLGWGRETTKTEGVVTWYIERAVCELGNQNVEIKETVEATRQTVTVNELRDDLPPIITGPSFPVVSSGTYTIRGDGLLPRQIGSVWNIDLHGKDPSDLLPALYQPLSADSTVSLRLTPLAGSGYVHHYQVDLKRDRGLMRYTDSEGSNRGFSWSNTITLSRLE